MKLKLLAIAILLILTLNKIQAQIPSYIPKDSLVGWWPFNGNANDESGNGNNGTVYDATLTRDRFNNSNSAFYFDGKSYIYGSANNFPTRNRTISMWYLADTLGRTNHRTLLYGYGGGSCGNAWIVNFENPGLGTNWFGKIEIQGHCTAFGSSADYPSQYKNTWHHFVVTYDYNSEIISYYFDGKLSKQVKISKTTTGTNNRLWVFGSYTDWHTNNIYNGSGDYPFEGKIDDIAIWNRALDSNEIKSLYEAKSCKLSITIEPQNIGCFSGNLDFTLSTNDTTAKYQWQTNQGTGWLNLSNAGQYSGVTTDSLVVKNITTSNDGQLFRCIAIGNCGKDTTREAKLSVWGVGFNKITAQKISIYPNPVKNTLNIAGLNNFYYKIQNLTGQSVLSGYSKGQIDIEMLKTGVYILEINNQKIKFIKE